MSVTVHLALVFDIFIAVAVMVMVCGHQAHRDKANTRFHGCDIFRKIGRRSLKNSPFCEIPRFSVNFYQFSFIYQGFLAPDESVYS